MEETTRAKLRILYTGASSGQDFNTLKDVGEILVQDGHDDLERAEVLWVDCATTKPDQYGHLLKAALDAGKTLVLNHLDSLASDVVSRIVGTRLEDTAETLLVSRAPGAPPPSNHFLTILTAPRRKAEPAHLEGSLEEQDWSKILKTHRAQTSLSSGGAGLIPPHGVRFGIRTQSAYSTEPIDWGTFLLRQHPEHGFNSSFHVYRENGAPNADYVVIRVQRATFDPGALLYEGNSKKGFWLFDLHVECSHDRTAPLLSTSPDSTLGPSIVTQLSIPLHVKLLQEGSCHPIHWPAAHGPVALASAGWGLANRSIVTSGKAAWHLFHREPWNSLENPLSEFSRWKESMYETISASRVKRLNLIAQSTFTLENVAVWRFNASDIATNPVVTFTDKVSHKLVAFSGTGLVNLAREYALREPASLSKAIPLNLPQVTGDVTSPCD